ncbi:MAG: nucleoside phosphorylase, partial [Bacteroidales bacterium]|nr:nucleoside phosphorylase [Bacteroidales bacterium]
MKQIEESELIVNADGSIFHLHLLPEQLADDVILVGDPGRVALVSKHFDNIECKVQNREFVTHTGTYKGKRISVLATGIGTDNIDIVMNELDALANIDLKRRVTKDEHRTLNLLRIGTSGGLQEDIEIGTFLLTETAVGFDGLLNFYRRRDEVCNLDMEEKFVLHTSWNPRLANPYFVDGSDFFLKKFGKEFRRGITISAPGFYGPQGRELRLEIQDRQINDKIRSFRYDDHYITNYEMESSAIFGLSRLLGHNAGTVCLIIANRYAKHFANDAAPLMEDMIEKTLETID